MKKRKIKNIISFIITVSAAALSLTGCKGITGGSSDKPVFKDGMAQPVFSYSDLRDPGYSNEDSDILRYCVYVETDHDTDGDGMADLVKVFLQVPRAAAEGRYKAATIYDPTPYGAGTDNSHAEDDMDLLNPVPFDYDKLYDPGEKRTPEGSIDTLDAAYEADPGSWNYQVPWSEEQGYIYANFYDYYLVRGFAVAEASGIGTYGSEGFELCGLDLERDSHKCVVEWLAGKRIAYTDPYDNIEISADWSNGKVGMTGTSYGGTIPYEVATTGVEGLKTIVPFAGIASWYDYTNSQGVPLNFRVAYTDYLAAYNAGAAYIDDNWTVIDDDYASYLYQMSSDQEATNGDYDDIWEKSDYSHDTDKINCSALIVHGLNDFNVLTKQSDLMARAFEKAGKPYKLVLHQDGHNNLDELEVNGELWQEIMNKWFSHYLYDIENGIENMPKVTVQSNVDGSFKTYDTWREFEFEDVPCISTASDNGIAKIDTTMIASFSDEYMNSTDDFTRPLTRDSFYLSMPEDTARVYDCDLKEDKTIYGVPEVHLKLSTEDTSLEGLMVSALLIDTIDDETPFKAYMTKEQLGDILPSRTVDTVDAGEGLDYIGVKEFVQSNTTSKLITFGYTDLQNYGGGYDANEYRAPEKDTEPGKYYDYTIYLQPTVYTLQPGHKLELVITGWDPYKSPLDEDYYNNEIDDPSQSKFTYSFTIDEKALRFMVPHAKGK